MPKHYNNTTFLGYMLYTQIAFLTGRLPLPHHNGVLAKHWLSVDEDQLIFVGKEINGLQVVEVYVTDTTPDWMYSYEQQFMEDDYLNFPENWDDYFTAFIMDLVSMDVLADEDDEVHMEPMGNFDGLMICRKRPNHTATSYARNRDRR